MNKRSKSDRLISWIGRCFLGWILLSLAFGTFQHFTSNNDISLFISCFAASGVLAVPCMAAFVVGIVYVGVTDP